MNANIAAALTREPRTPPANDRVDRVRAEAAIRELLIAVGEDPDREGLRDTPRRVAKMYEELFAGLRIDPSEALERTFREDHDELVMLRDIQFSSLCEHHLLPFIGRAHVAYLPRGEVVGISKLARTVHAFARRPQVQERLTAQVADALMDHLGARGALVVIEAQHFCMKMRGVNEPHSSMITSVARGHVKQDSRLRAEAMSLLTRGT